MMGIYTTQEAKYKSAGNEADGAKVSQVATQLAKQAALSEELHKALADLEDRLNQVLQVETPQATVRKGEDAPPLLVPLAMMLNERNEAISYAIGRMRSMRIRLEL